MTSDAHEYTVYIVTYTVVVVCLFVCFRGGGGLKMLSKGRGNGNRETITGKKEIQH